MITDAKISNAAKISPAKIAPAQVGQLMVAQANGKYASVTISGDANLAADGKLRLKNVEQTSTGADYESLNEQALKKSDLKEGKTLVGGATTPLEVPVGTGASAIPQRDSSGDLQAENSAKLNSQDPSYYVNTDNQTAGSSTAVDGGSGVLDHTVQTIPTQIVTATTTNNCADKTDYVVAHGFGSMPLDVKVFEGSSTMEEVEVEVESTTTQSTVKFSPPGPSVDFTIKILGQKP